MTRRTLLRLALAVTIAAVPAATARAESIEEMRAIAEATRAALDKIRPCLVTIETFGGTPVVKGVPLIKGKDGEAAPAPLVRPGASPGPGPGTGLVIDAGGWIVASAFQFKDEPTSIVVTIEDGTSRSAKLVGQDLSRGVALLSVDFGDRELPVPEFRASDSVRVGEWALSIGRALAGENPMVQIGIISAKDRISGRALQTDALTSPVNFGGPLIDLEGRVYGVIVPLSPHGLEAAVRSYDSGIGFAVPLDLLAGVMPRLRAGETLRPAFLGVSLDQASTGTGARILGVLADTPAARAGLQPDDVIIRLGVTEIDGAFSLQHAIARHVAGDRVTLRYRRGTDEHDVEVELAVPPPPRPPQGGRPAGDDDDDE